MPNMDRRTFMRAGALTGAAVALGLSAEAQDYRLSKETWALQQTPESHAILDKHPILGRFVTAILDKHPLVHEYFRVGDICIQGFGADRYTGQRLEFDRAEEGIVQAFAMTLAESEADRARHNHPQLGSRGVHLTGPLENLSQAEMLGALLDTAAAINKLQQPYHYLTTNSNKVYVTLANRLGFCHQNNCSQEVEDVKPYALFGADIPFNVTPDTHYQTMAQHGKSPEDIRRAFNVDHMHMFPNASANLKGIGPRFSQDRVADLTV